MKKLAVLLSIVTLIAGCKLSNNNQTMQDNSELSALLDKYYEERLQLFPVEATIIGDSSYNDQLYIDFTDGYRQKLKEFYTRNSIYISKFERDALNENDKLSYDAFKREMEINIGSVWKWQCNATIYNSEGLC